MVSFIDQGSHVVLEVEQRWRLQDEIQEGTACQDRVGQSARFGFVDKILLNAGHGRKEGEGLQLQVGRARPKFRWNKPLDASSNS